MAEKFKSGIPRETREKSYLQSFDRQKLDSSDPADFASKLLSFVRQNKVAADALIAGNVQMLGFEALRERFGDQWDGIKDKVHLLTETTIKKHISSDDVYCLMNDEQFIVLFGRATKAAAGVTANLIGKEVNEKLSGAGAGGDAVSVKPMVFEVPRTDPPPKTIEGLGATVEEAQRAAEKAEEARIEAAREKLGIRFWPVANMRKRLVSCYQAEITAPEDVDLDVDVDPGTGAAAATLDRFLLQKAGVALTDATSQGMKAFLIVPVHFDTLAIKSFRTRYLEICKILPQVADRKLVLLINGLEDGVPQARLHGIFTYLSPYVSGFIGQFGRGFRRADKLGGLQMMAVAMDGTGMDHPGPPDVSAMKEFVVGNKSRHIRRYFMNAGTFDCATMARRARFDYVQGIGVAPAMPMHGKVFNI